jgi:DNA-binding PadR family transcriptional regulator
MTTREGAARRALTREVLLGFSKIHVLRCAAHQRVDLEWLLDELRRHGQVVASGTLYEVLRRMERNGWLESNVDLADNRGRRGYRATPEGVAVLAALRDAVAELHHQLAEDPTSLSGAAPYSLVPPRIERTEGK